MARNSSRAYQNRARLIIARDGGLCGICGHGNAITTDHIIPHRDWPRDHLGQPLPGLDDPDNLRAAHGTRGVAQHNPCLECGGPGTPWPHGRMCNQSRGAGAAGPEETHSRSW